MRERNIYQCTEECRDCTYEKKNPTGYDDDFDECTTDHCPKNHYQLGNIDRLNGRHSEGYGWNPLGEFCNQCKHTTCEDCIKWSNRDKKLRNNIPPELKQPKKTVTKEPEKQIVESPKEEKPESLSVVEQALKIMEEEKQRAESKVHDQAMLNTNNTFIDTDRIADASSMDDFDFDDFDEKENQQTTINAVEKENIKPEEKENDTEDVEYNNNDDEENDADIDNNAENESDDLEEIDFGMDAPTYDEQEEYADVSFDDDDIPAPSDYEETSDSDDEENDSDNEKEDDDKQYDDDEEDDDDDDDDYDEDDEAEFALFEQTKKLKASILFAPDTKIAQYNVRNTGVYLTVTGDSKVTVKGRNDSDGFSYCDPNRFPRYIREGILSGDLYKNENIKITDNSKFIFVYYNDIDGEILKRGSMECKTDLTDVTEEKLRKLLKRAMDKFQKDNED